MGSNANCGLVFGLVLAPTLVSASILVTWFAPYTFSSFIRCSSFCRFCFAIATTIEDCWASNSSLAIKLYFAGGKVYC